MTMRVLWISCLLIGSITCYPVGKGYGSNSAGTSYNSPEAGTYGAAYPSSGYGGGAAGGGYGSSASAYAGDSSYGFVAGPRDESWSSASATGYGTSDENPEPVFSDVSDLEPVYSFSSRSSYQRGRALFAQTRYIPGAPPLPPQPVYRSTGKTAPTLSNPAKAPAKGGF